MVLAAQDQGMVMPRDAIERAINWKFFSDESPPNLSDQEIRTDANPLLAIPTSPWAARATSSISPRTRGAAVLANWQQWRSVACATSTAAGVPPLNPAAQSEPVSFAQLEPGTERGTNGRDPARRHSRDCPEWSQRRNRTGPLPPTERRRVLQHICRHCRRPG
jgi:hypothetical protein